MAELLSQTQLEAFRLIFPAVHFDWLFEIKWDGFRSLVRIEQGKCRLVSRKGNDFKSFRTLNESLFAELKVRSAVLDGEIVCLNDQGKPEFRDLLFRQGEPRIVVSDLLWCSIFGPCISTFGQFADFTFARRVSVELGREVPI